MATARLARESDGDRRRFATRAVVRTARLEAPALSAEPYLPAAAEAVLTFLESVGRRSEAELYLGLFRQLPKQSFAIVVTEAAVIRHARGSLLEDLKFLADLGLVAPVVLGASSPDTALRGASELARHLPRIGLAATQYEMTAPGLGELVCEELLAERIPLLWFGPEPEATPRDRFGRVGRLAQDLRTRKVVLVRQRGSLAFRDDAYLAEIERLGLLGPQGELSVVNLRTDRDALSGRVLRAEDQRLLDCVGALLEAATPEANLTVSVTSPLNLLRELFTVRGDGTLIKVGADVKRVASFTEVDCCRLQGLLERSFGRALRPEFFQRTPSSLYVEADYRGAAILEPSGVAPYLSKLAVEPLAQGEGIARDLWQALARDHAAFFWRARPQNPITSWYLSRCDGVLRLSDWHVYWRGLVPEQIPEAVAEALARPEDFDR